MKALSVFLLTALISVSAKAQVSISADYIAPSKYRDVNNNKTGAEGDAKHYQLGFQIPVSLKMDEKERPTMWSVGLQCSSTSLGTKNSLTDIGSSEIGNLIVSVDHLRPISENWLIYASLGVGVFADHTNFSKIEGQNIMGVGNLIFIRPIFDNLKVGIGVALDTEFGYPMLYPAFLINWNLDGKYFITFNPSGLKMGVKMSDHFNFNIYGTMKGSTAFMKKDGKRMQFSHMYVFAGIQPEFKLGKFSMPITIGVSCVRPAYYEERTIKGFWDVYTREFDPYYSISPAISVALQYGF